MVKRAYTFMQVRAVDEEKRIIEGIATTPVQARDKAILETAGIQFKLPIPFLYAHNVRQPIGNVESAKVTSQGIGVRVQIAPAGTADFIDESWRLIKSGTVRGLSIAWRTLEEFYDKNIGGFRITKSEWLELSAVSVPADPNAMITAVRSADDAILAALGNNGNRSTVVRLCNQHPGVSGSTRTETMKPISEQIASFEAKRQSHATRMEAILETSSNEGRSLDANEQQEYDGLCSEVEAIDAHLGRLRTHEKNIASARPVVTAAGADPLAASGARGGAVVTEVKSNLPKGHAMARMVIALVNARGNHMYAAELAKQHYKDSPEVALVLRAAVEAGDTTTSGWASQLIPAAQQMQSEFIELLRPATIIGRIPNLRRVPFNVAVPLQTGGGTYGWVGEAKPKPVTSLVFSNATLRWAKAAGIVVITRELARFSSPSAEAIIRDDMIQGCARFLDTQFVDDGIAEVSNVHPASITNGISPESPTGTTAEAFRFDLSVLMADFISAKQDPTNAVLLMSATTAMGLALMVNALGQPEFPSINVNGGTIQGLPVVVSENVGSRLILLNARDILFADDGGVTIDVSEQASVEMDTTPIGGETSPITGAVLKSLWQENLVGLRVERFITWKRARNSAIAWTDGVAYAPTQPSSPA